MKKVLEVKNLNKSFGNRQILTDVSFSLDTGDILAFIGPNGSGKTTTIKLILGLQTINSGTVLINGYDIKKDFIDAIKGIGAIVENPDSYMYLTGWQNLKLTANLYKGVTDEAIMEIVKLVKLEDRIYDTVNKYSLGMRQRLGIARSLINNPNVLVLDEPTNGLDPEGIKELRELLVSLAKKNMAILISSHNLAELENFCNKVLIIEKGKIIEAGKITEFKKNTNKYIIKVDSTKNIKLDNMSDVTDTTFVLTCESREIPKVISMLVKEKVSIYEVKELTLTLEEAFLERTGGNK